MRTSVPSIAHIPTRPTTGRARWTSLVKRVGVMWQVFKERDRLNSLDDRMLRDLGIDRSQVDNEVRRSFTDIPENRL